MKRWKSLGTLVCVLALLAFSIYALLDALVISRVYAVVDQNGGEQTTVLQSESASQAQTLSSHRGGKHGRSSERSDESADVRESESTEQSETEANSCSDGEVSVRIDTYRAYDTTIYVADVTLESADSLKTAFSRSSYGRNVTAATSDTAASVGAILAVNGDNYGAREKGYVIRNGVLYRDTAVKNQEDLVIYADGSFEIIREDEVTAQTLLERGAVQVFSFGPGLIEDGAITVGASDEVARAMVSNPRTAIGILEEGHYLIVVSDGRSEESEGLSLYELAEFMQSLGVQTAYNLDGGGSSTLVFQGTVVNQPSSGRERAVTDIIYIAGGDCA